MSQHNDIYQNCYCGSAIIAMPLWDVVNGVPLQWSLAEGGLSLLVYIICQDGGTVGFVDFIDITVLRYRISMTLLSFHSLCLHLRSHLTKWKVFQNTSS